MSKRRDYAGAWTALITPFQKDDSIDEISLKNLVQLQINGGITGVVPLGTTGESPTITNTEKEAIFRIVVEEAKDKIMVMAGTGSNCTKKAIENTKIAKKAGADCCLVVAPYYNKPSPAGLIAHFNAIADIGLPVIVYNIKGRTGINIDTNTLLKIAEHKNIVGVKEASGDLNQINDVITNRPENFTVLSGDDSISLDLISIGGDGVVSVASNIVPDKIAELIEYSLDENHDAARKIHHYLSEMFEKLFIETNPLPVKYIASKMGLCKLKYRLPMCSPEEKSKKILDELLNNYKLIK